MKLKIGIAGFAALVFVAGIPSAVFAQSAYELWPDLTSLPTLDQYAFAPLPHQLDETTGDEYHHLGDETMERNGQHYKVVQWFHDTEFEVVAPVGKYFLGLLGHFYPKGTIDGAGLLRATRLVAVEIDGEVFELNEEHITFVADFPFPGVDLVSYNFLPRFTQPGTYTLRYHWRQVEPFFFVLPFTASHELELNPHAEDPLGLEGRRVLVTEREGDQIEGDMVLTYHLTVEEAPTVIKNKSWGELKKTRTPDK